MIERITGFLGAVLHPVILVWMLCQPVCAETFLPEQDISLNGTVVVPSCKIHTGADRLTFSKDTLSDQASQRLFLRLSQCDIEGLNIMFRAATWPGYPDRGILKSRGTRRPSAVWHFRLAPAPAQERLPAESQSWPLTLAAHTAELVKDTPTERDNPQGQYFNLNSVVYEYSAERIPQGQGELVIPFVVSLHSTGAGEHTADDELESAFALQVSYR